MADTFNFDIGQELRKRLLGEDTSLKLDQSVMPRVPELKLREPMSDDSLLPYTRKGAAQLALEPATPASEVSPTTTEAPADVTEIKEPLDISPRVEVDKKAATPTWSEKRSERYLKSLDEQDQMMKKLYNQIAKARGMPYEDEQGTKHNEDRGLLGFGGKLQDTPDYRRDMLNKSMQAIEARSAANYGIQPYGSSVATRTPAPVVTINPELPEVEKTAKIMQDLGSNKISTLQGAAPLGREMEAERQRQIMETPGNVRASAGIEFLKSFPQGQKWIADLAAKAPGGESGLSAADIDPYVKFAQQMGLGQMKNETQLKVAEMKQKLQQDKDDERFMRWISEKTKAKMVWDPDHPGEMVDTNTGLRLSGPHLERYLRLFGEEKGKPASAVIPSVGPRKAVPTVPGPGSSAIPSDAPATPAPGTPGANAYPISDAQEARNLTAKHVQKQVGELADALNPTKNGGISMRNALEAERRAQNMRASLGEENIDANNMPKKDPYDLNVAEMAVQLNTLLSGRAGGTATEFKHLMPSGLSMDVNSLQQYFTSEPGKVAMKEWVKLMLDIADKEARKADDFIKGQLAPRVAGKGVTLDREAPRKRDEILRSNSLDPAAFHKDGTIGDYHFYQPPTIAPDLKSRAKAQGKVIYYNYKDGRRVQASADKPEGTWLPVGD